MAINRYAYFTKGDGSDAAGDAVMVPVDNFTGAEVSLDDELVLNFKRVTAAFASDVSVFTIVHDTGASRECMEQVAAAFSSNPKDGFISIADVDKDGHGRFFAETGTNVIIDCTFSL